jgi:hypothetical protein
MSHSFSWITGNGRFAAASDWIDLTLGMDPAPVAPGSLDAVTIAGPGAGFQSIVGPGSVAAMGFAGDTSLAGTLATVILTVGAAAAGTVDVTAGTTLTAGAATLVAGLIAVSGAGADLSVAGTLGIGTAAILSVGNAGMVQAGALALNGGTLELDPTGVLEIGTAGGAARGTLSIDTGATLSSEGGVIAPNLSAAGVVAAMGGTTALLGSVTGTGTLAIGGGATLYVGGTAAASLTASFTGLGGVLEIYPASGGFAAPIAGFAAGDAIDFSGIVATGAQYAPTGAAVGTLTLTDAGQAVATVTLDGSYGGAVFLTTPDAVDGTLVLLPTGSIVAGGALSAGTSGPDAYLWTASGGGMWNSAANWRDVSARLQPALVAPGGKNIVTLAGPTGAAIALIGGPGNAASLIVTGAVALSGLFATGGLTVGSALAAGTLDILAGGTLTATTPSLIDGTLEANGAAALFAVNGILTEGPQTAGLPPPDVAALNGAYLKAHLMNLGGGTLGADASSTIEIGTPGNAAGGALTVDGGYWIHSTGGTITGAVIDKGTIQATGGETSLFGALSGAGLLTIGAGGTLFLAGGVASSLTVSFIASAGTLLLDGTAPGFAAGIAGFAAGDAIDISGLLLTGAAFTALNAGQGSLALSNGGVTVLSLALSGAYAGAVFQTAPDAVDGTLITLASGGSGAGALSAGTPTADVYRWAGASGGDWGSAANWTDVTLGGAAMVAPGSNDLVDVAGSGGASALLLSGQGAAADLSVSGNVALAGRFTAGAVTGVAIGTAPATLDVDATAMLAATSFGFGAGVAQVSGAGASLAVGGALTLGAASAASGPLLAVLGQAVAQAGTLLLNAGTVLVDSESVLEIGNAGNAAPGVLTVDATATLVSMGGTIGSPMTVNGLLLAEGGTTSLLSDVSGGGTLSVGAGAELSIYGTIGATTTLAFAAAAGRLVLNAATDAVAGTIMGFAPGAIIDIAATTLTAAAYAAGSGTLVLSSDGVAVTTLTLAGNFAGDIFRTLPDGVDGTLVSVGPVAQQAPCYAAGTRILTASGERCIEELQPGERLPTASGRMAPLRWVGRRRIGFAAGRPDDGVCPVRVRAGAFAPGRPHRDLVLSPAHALFIDGALIPVHLLVNGATVAREPGVGAVTYLHVELDRHDVIFAEGLPAESWLDTGNRGAFANAPGATPLDAAAALAIWARSACATLVLEGDALAVARRRLAQRATEMGWHLADAPDARLVADGRVLRPDMVGGQCRFAVPRGAGRLRLVSRSFVPAEHGMADHRRLGLAIRRISADGVRLAPSGTGWYPPERDLQWTDGDAVLDCPGARQLVLETAPMRCYWQAPPAGPALSPARLAAR